MRHYRLLNPSQGPREGIPFVDPLTGWTSKGKTLPLLFAAAREHRESNALPIPDDFDLQIETQWCRQNPDLCVSRDGLPIDLSCAHRGEQVRWEGCDTCGGVRAKVMACALHGECSEFKYDVGVKRCGLCQDRKSLLTDED